MNILVIALHGMYQDYTASYVHNQARAYVQQGHRVRAVIPLAIGKRSNEGRRVGPLVEMVEKDGVEICYVRHLSLSNYGKRHFNIASFLTVLQLLYPRVLRDFQPDVIHANAIDFGGEVGRNLKKLCGAKLVITTHGSDTNEALNLYPARAKELCDSADAVVAVSRQLMEKVDLLGSSVKTLRILNGFAAENICLVQKIPHHLIQVGNLVPCKHVELTIRAVATLKKSYPDITLTVVGSGPERSRWEDLAKAEGLSDAVTFLGRLPNDEALKEMSKAEIFCMPSYPEGFGIAYLEAMASGCVAIGTQGEGIADVISSGENGFLVPRDSVDAIVEIVDHCFSDAEQMHRITDAGKATAMSMTWENNAKQYIDLFCELRREQQGTCGV